MQTDLAPARNSSLDALRVLSLVGIITLHVAGGGFPGQKPLAFLLDELSRFAVPVFFLMSAYFWKPDALANPLRLVRRVAGRVLPAFAFWTAVFVVLRVLKQPDRGFDFSLGSLATLAWTGGPAFHLWFLPALVVGTAVVAGLARLVGWKWTLAGALLLYIAGAVIGTYSNLLLGHGFPFWYDRNGIFFAPVFLVLGVLLRRYEQQLRMRLPTAIVVSALVAFAALHVAEGYFVAGRFPMGHDYSLGTLGYAVAMVVLFARLPIGGSLWSKLGLATFSAYLIHPLVLEVLVMGLQLGRHPLLVIVLCAAISLAIAMAFRGLVRRARVPRAA